MSHVMVLFVVLFFYKGDNFTHKLTFAMNDMTVMFLPFQKTTTALSSQASTKKSGAKIARVANKQQAQKKTIAAPKGKAAKLPATALADAAKKTKKNSPKIAIKKEAIKEKQVVAKKAEEKPKPVKKEEPVVETIDFAQENVAYLGQQDRTTLMLKRELLSEIEQAWHPPAGIASGKSCKVRVLVGWQGTIEEIIFEEPSNIAAFDVSVRHALLTMKFPKSSFGKELILPFH
jgi:hypothetical protein